MTRDELRSYLSFYRDLGVTEIYRRPQAVAAAAEPVPELPPLAPSGDTLLQIRQDIGEDCRRCRLCEARSKIVFGSGNEQSKLVFVGEGPGADEDAQGLPFVGRAGSTCFHANDREHRLQGRYPDPPSRRLYLQRGQVPPTRESHAFAGRNGSLWAVPVPPAYDDQSQRRSARSDRPPRKRCSAPKRA